MSEEDKAKLKELWDYIEQFHEHWGTPFELVLEKFEQLFTKELND